MAAAEGVPEGSLTVAAVGSGTLSSVPGRKTSSVSRGCGEGAPAAAESAVNTPEAAVNAPAHAAITSCWPTLLLTIIKYIGALSLHSSSAAGGQLASLASNCQLVSLTILALNQSFAVVNPAMAIAPKAAAVNASEQVAATSSGTQGVRKAL